MKIAQVIRRFSFSEWGGTESVVWNTSCLLQQMDSVELEILATSALEEPGTEVVDGVPIRRFPYYYPYFPLDADRCFVLDKKGGNPFAPQMERYLMQQDFQMIHCHNLGRLAELAARVSERKKIPFLVSLHGGCADVPHSERAELLRPTRHTIPYGGVMERILGWKRNALACASGIVCVGKNEFHAMSECFPDKKILYLPNGVDPAKFSGSGCFDWRSELDLPADCQLFLNVSRIDYQKNQKLLLEFVHLLRSAGHRIHLLMIGPVTAQWYYQEMQELLDGPFRNIKDSVTIIPGLQNEDPSLIAAYRQADLFLLPSLHEPFGIVVLEAWCAGVPVIASRVGGLASLIHDHVDGLLFESNSVESLMKAYHVLPFVRNTIVQNAKNEVMRNYQWSMITKRLLDFYDEVIHEFRP